MQSKHPLSCVIALSPNEAFFSSKEINLHFFLECLHFLILYSQKLFRFVQLFHILQVVFFESVQLKDQEKRNLMR